MKAEEIKIKMTLAVKLCMTVAALNVKMQDMENKEQQLFN